MIQTLAYEFFALVLVVPIYSHFAGATATQGFVVILALAVAAIAWSPLHNTLFDLAEWRVSGRVASDRPQHLRMLHAVSHEFSQIVVSVPILMVIGGHAFWEAILVDIGLTGLYAAYAWVFHMAFDALRPVPIAPAQPVSPVHRP
jgi:uncharacterized membrane protein